MLALRSSTALAVAALVLGACAAGGITQRDELKMAVEDFNNGVRWDKVDQSASRLPLERRRAFAERYANLAEELEIMDYDVQRIEWDRSTGKATVRVEMSWSLKRRGVVERTILDEEWHKDGGWFLIGAKKVRGSLCPLFEFPAAKPPQRAATDGPAAPEAKPAVVSP